MDSMKIWRKFTTGTILNALLLVFISHQSHASDELLGVWNSLSGNVKFMTKNRYRGLSGSMLEWQTIDKQIIKIDNIPHRFSIEINPKTGMQLLHLIPIIDGVEKNKIRYYRKIPTRTIDKALILATLENNSSEVKRHLESGANPFATDYDIGDRKAAYLHAIKSNDSKLINIYLPFVKTKMQEHFFEAIDANQEATVSAFIHANINVNITDNMHTTPLMHAIVIGNMNTIKELLKSGANPNVIDGHGNSTLSYTRHARQNAQLITDYLTQVCPGCE